MLSNLLQFLAPWACAGCRIPLPGEADDGFCGLCWLALPRIQGCVCRFCGVPLKDGGDCCFRCRTTPSRIMIRGALVYSGAVRTAIHRFKYAGRKSLSRCFTLLLRSAYENYRELQPVDAVIPVPLHPSTTRQRGYNQAFLLAQALADVYSLPILDRSLIRKRRTTPQFHLPREARLKNLRQAFQTANKSSIQGKHLLLIDDVSTTAATLHECAKALRRAGARDVKALVLARDI